ncbi:glycosyltransferase 87 family protein [Aquimarina brevivitae]|uniref:glycosyltransferase 87 family protein n=1 Tax=Aquimarina brevivitae TaxID=323412 RepID=UPI001F5F6F08|nr:glycosyltransferase 87 family protein [Aquimarina brevivitae]
MSAFLLSYTLLKSASGNFTTLVVAGLLFRIVFIVAIPNLSQDFYRFIWDGRMLLAGYNPYLSLPEEWITSGNTPIPQANILYEGMGELNGSHYTNYPPLSQLCYVIAALLAGKSITGSVIVLRALIILADIGILVVGRKLLIALNLKEYRIFWYFLNPFIIIELTGNLHFEAIMIFFITWAIYLLHKGLWVWAGIVLGLAVSVKLIPLLFLPVFFQKFVGTSNKKISKSGILKFTAFVLMTLGTVLLSFLPFLSYEFIENFTRTLRLWFQRFEFNASIYYIIRWIGYKIVGWNIIETAGKILPFITLCFILLLSWIKKNSTTKQLITGCLLGLSFYYFLSTTVHPWYIAVPLVLSIFTNYKFAIAWSIAVILSYTAYLSPDFKENLWLIGLEYSIVCVVLYCNLAKPKTLLDHL